MNDKPRKRKYTTVGRVRIVNGVTIGNPFVPISSWYDKTGKNVGFGELSLSNLENISRNLSGNELFIIINRGDKRWSFLSGAVSKYPDGVYDDVSINFLYSNASLIISRDGKYVVDYIDSRNVGNSDGYNTFVVKMGRGRNRKKYQFYILPHIDIHNFLRGYNMSPLRLVKNTFVRQEPTKARECL